MFNAKAQIVPRIDLHAPISSVAFKLFPLASYRHRCISLKVPRASFNCILIVWFYNNKVNPCAILLLIVCKFANCINFFSSNLAFI